jgi:hypothetical protein
MGAAKASLLRSDKPLVYIQGSRAFVTRVLLDLTGKECGLISAIVPKEDVVKGGQRLGSLGGLSWKQLCHRKVSGATQGAWMLGTSCTIKKQLFWASKVKRNLGHNLSNLESGSPAPPGKPLAEYKGQPIFRQHQRLPAAVTNVTVEYPSVFHGNQAVIRNITDRELMEVYDVDIPTQTSLQAFWKNENLRATRAFCLAAPVKVLVAGARAALLVSGNVAIPQLGLFRGKEGGSTFAEFDPARVPRYGLERDDLSLNINQSTLEKPVGVKPDVKAVKRDDAQVDSSQWDIWCVDHLDTKGLKKPPLVCLPGTFSLERHGRLFDALRGLLHRVYRKRVTRGLLKYLNEEYDKGRRDLEESTSIQTESGTVARKFKVSSWTRQLRGARRRTSRKKRQVTADDNLFKDLTAGLDCVERVARSSWWSWDDGSRILFWRWPKCYQKNVRDGTPLFLHKALLPSYWKPQSWPNCPQQREQLKTKLNVPRAKRYIVVSYVKSKTGFFAVAKGENDIRIVYDASKCGLNDALWCPSFFLPTIDSILRNADSGTWFGDIDLGEMFLNFMLDEQILPWVGVDVTELCPGQGKAVIE